MNIYQQISNYNGYNKFIISLRGQLLTKGSLSDKQINAAQSVFKTSLAPIETIAPKFTYKTDDELMVRKWFAQVKAKELKLQYFFRNIIIVEVLAETSKAIQVKLRFNDKVTTVCHLCGLGLDTEVSKATGIGPVCAKRLGFKRVTLNDASAILAKVTDEAKIAGTIGPIWLPKSQIISKAEQVLFEE